MQELPSHAIAGANKVVVESKEAALDETGDLQVPIKEGLFKANAIHAELGQIISKEKLDAKIMKRLLFSNQLVWR